MLFEIVNPSDKVLIESDDETVAAFAVLLLGNGMFGLRRADAPSRPMRSQEDYQDDTVLPILGFSGIGGLDAWLHAKGICSPQDMETWQREHVRQLADCYGSAFYGSPSEKRALDDALAGLPADEIKKRRAAYNDKRRSSMTNIGSACAAYEKHFRKIADESEGET